MALQLLSSEALLTNQAARSAPHLQGAAHGTD